MKGSKTPDAKRRNINSQLTKSASGIGHKHSRFDRRPGAKTPSKSALRGNHSPRRKGSLKVSFNLGRNHRHILSSTETDEEEEDVGHDSNVQFPVSRIQRAGDSFLSQGENPLDEASKEVSKDEYDATLD